MNKQTISKPEELIVITKNNYFLLQPSWLSHEGIRYNLRLFVLDLAESGDMVLASEFFQFLHSLIQKNSNLIKTRPDMFADYLRLLAVLKACFLGILPESEISQFLKENLLKTLEVIDFDVSIKLNQLLVLRRSFSEAYENFRKNYQKAIEENKELLGSQGLKMAGGKSSQEPTVANWLLDYNQFSVSYISAVGANLPGVHKGSLGGNFERVSYIQKSSNVQKLSKDEKTILFRLLELYDWLKHVKPKSEFNPVFAVYLQSGSGFSQVLEEAPEESQIQAPEEVKTVSKPEDSKKPVPTIQNSKSINIQDIMEGKSKVEPNSPASKVREGKFNNTSPNLPKEYIYEKSKVNIDQKLEELSEEVKKRKIKKP